MLCLIKKVVEEIVKLFFERVGILVLRTEESPRVYNFVINYPYSTGLPPPPPLLMDDQIQTGSDDVATTCS